MNHLAAVTGVQNLGSAVGRSAEADDHAVDMSLDFGFAVPAECPMGKVNVYTALKEGLP